MNKHHLFKLLAHLLCWLPLGWLVISIIQRNLGGDPQKALLHQLGLWALIFLLLSLSVSPLRKIFNYPRLVNFRRMLGLYSAFYLLLHLTTFFWFILDRRLTLLIEEVIKRPYITLGIAAFLMMIPLVVTSTKAMQRRMGKKWKKLHLLVFPIAIAAIIHFIWQSKSDLNEPLWYTLWLLLLLGYRLKNRYQSNTGLNKKISMTH